MSEHTPLPWRIWERAAGTVVGADPKRIRTVASCTGYSSNVPGEDSQAENIANAEFIVRACNSHDPLVEACEAVLDELPPTDYLSDATLVEIVIRIQDALRLARGGDA